MLERSSTRVLFVCLGNICRSPMAEGIFRAKVAAKNLDILVDSAGTGGWHTGEAPDKRAIEMLQKKGLNISDLRARKFIPEDFDRFDHIFVMDSSNYQDIVRQARNTSEKNKVELFLNLSNPSKNQAVPDPYYGGEEGFENVYHLLNQACDVLIKKLE